MINFEITKKQKILEVNNSMCHNYYYVIYGRIYNEEHTKYKKFKYIEWFDVFDVMEFFETDCYNDKLVKEYLNNLENSYLLNIKDYNDIKNLKEFYNYCNETIKKYNDIAKYY